MHLSSFNLHFNFRFFFLVSLVVLIGSISGVLAAFLAFLLSFLYLKNKRLEFLLIIFFLTFFLGDNIDNFLSFANNLRFLLIGFSIIYLIPSGLFKNNFGWRIGLFTVYGFVITLLFSPLGVPALSRSLAYLLMALIVFKLLALLYQRNPFEVESLILSFLIFFIFLNFITIPIRSEGTFYLVGRFKGLLNNPNGLGLLLMFIYPILDFFLKTRDYPLSRRMYLFLKILIFIMLLLSGSRTALLSVIIYQLTVIFFENRRLWVPYVLLLFPLLYVIITTDLIQLFTSLGLGQDLRLETLTTASGRTEVWAVAWEEIKRFPFLGQGMMYDNFYIDEYRGRYLGDNVARHWYGVWSSYFSLLLNVGVIGLGLYLLFLWRCFQRSQNKKLAFGFLLLVLSSAVTESWMAASMNAFTPLLFLYFAVQQQTIYYHCNEEDSNTVHSSDRVLDGVHAS